MAPNPELMTGLGAAASIFFCSFGSALASVQSAKYAMRSTQGYFLSFAPIVISGVLAIYGIIVAVLLGGRIQDADTTGGYKYFSAGLAVGLACLASGMGMAGFLEDSLLPCTSSSWTQVGTSTSDIQEPLVPRNSRSTTQMSVQQAPVRFLMCLVFLEAIGLYGLIVALILIG